MIDYFQNPHTREELKELLGVKDRQFFDILKKLRKDNNITLKDGKYFIEKRIEEEKIEGYTRAELKAILKQLKVIPNKPKTYEIGDEHIVIGVISDAHIGNKCYEPGLMNAAAKTFKDRDVKFVIDAGDTCDGFYRDRPGHVFELEHIGADEQVERAVKELKKLEKPIFGITGNHTTNAFFNTAGYDIGKRLEERLNDYTYLGRGEGFIQLPYNHKIQIIHPDGGSSYAVSYRSQKIAESLEGGTKPNLLIIGHFHKVEYLFYRNIHIIQAGTLEHQTPFMKGRHLQAMLGYFVLDITVGKSGITKFSPDFYPGY